MLKVGHVTNQGGALSQAPSKLGKVPISFEGVELRTDGGAKRVINWPEQHKKNGIAKNNETGRRYKRMVRIMKSINDLTENPVPGFLLECLMWNVPNQYCTQATYEQSLRARACP